MMRIIEKLNTPAAFVIALVLVLAIDGLLFLRYRITEESAATAPPATTTQLESTQASSAPASKQQGPETTTQSSPATTTGATTASSEKTAPLRVGLRVEDKPTWLSIQVDGEVPYMTRAEPGFFQEFEANDEADIWAGNAEALEVETNGQSQGRLSVSGEAGSRTFRC
jgi:hypothetical protein